MSDEGRIAQLLSLMDSMIQDHVVLHHARTVSDAATVEEYTERVRDTKAIIQRLLEQLIL